MFVWETCSKGVWPLLPSCLHTVAFGLYTAFGLLLLLLEVPSCFMQTNDQFAYAQLTNANYPMSFYMAFAAQALMVATCIGFVPLLFAIHQYSHLLTAYVVGKGIFWSASLFAFYRCRKLPVLPISLALGYGLASIIQIAPLTNWAAYFPEHTLHNGEFVFYTVETVLTLFVFFVTLVKSPFSSSGNQPSTWSNFSHKISLIAPFVWPKRSCSLQLRVLVCLFLLLLGRMINVALPLYNKWIVNALGEPHTFPYSLIIISTGLKFLQGNGAMGGFLNTLRTYLWIPIQQYTTRELEAELFEHLHSLSLRWHLARKTGLVLRVMDRGTSSINSILNYVLFNILPTIADITIAVIFFFSSFNIYFGFIVLATMLIYLALTITVTEWRTKFRREMNEKENEWSAIGTDSLLNYETVKYYGNEWYEVDRFRAAILAFQSAEWRSNASLALLNLAQNSVIGAGLTAGSVLVAYLISVDGSLTVGDYVLFTTYILQLYSPLNFFGTVYRVIQKSFIDMENMFDLMHEEVEVKDRPDALDYTRTEGRITVENLSFSYDGKTPVLKDISFDVKSGQTVALVGASGCGKSTLVRLLFRLFEAPPGTINFDGQDIQNIRLRHLRSHIGIVPQDTVLFNNTILYNIRFGRPSATDEEVFEAAKAAMIHEKILNLPDRYETLVGERGLRLSGGEKQRVAIARTLLKQPDFIFLDEATSALDTGTERAIQHCLEELCSSRTSVVVAHRLSTVVNASQILVLDKGRIAERGTHLELLAVGGLYANMWNSQMAENSGSSPSSTEINEEESTA